MIFCKKERKERITVAVLSLCAVFLLFYAVCKRAFPASVAASGPEPARVIVIDPGHGGQDGGAVALDGTPEKDFTLDLSRDFCVFLRLMGYTPVMTRTEDTDTDGMAGTFDKKIDIANRKAVSDRYPDAPFISVHVNLSTSRKDKGFQVFYGAKNEKSRLFADTVREKAVLSGLCTRVRDVAPAPDSVYLQQRVTAPCLLVECGFLSNAEDLDLLREEPYRQELMFTLACAVTEATGSPRPTPESPSA